MQRFVRSEKDLTDLLRWWDVGRKMVEWCNDGNIHEAFAEVFSESWKLIFYQFITKNIYIRRRRVWGRKKVNKYLSGA
ncbi:hypothetical protein DWX22_06210 [Coprococcus sp. AF18-48]|nr:hypothetical protein DWX22_06210 [Coprococcus sp. AF18-48]